MAKVLPNHYDCELCPNWDDVNGCEAGLKEFCYKEFDLNNPYFNF